MPSAPRERDGPEVVGDLGAPEEAKRASDPLERDGPDLRAVVGFGEGQQEVVGRLAELLPVELQEPRQMEEGAGRVGAHEVGPVPPLEVPPVLTEHDPHRRHATGRVFRSVGAPVGPTAAVAARRRGPRRRGPR